MSGLSATLLENEVEERVVTKPEVSNDKPEAAHIVMDGRRPERDDPVAWVMEARMGGFPITALCGFTWIPNKPTTGLPICQECVEIYESEDRSDDSGEGLPDNN